MSTTNKPASKVGSQASGGSTGSQESAGIGSDLNKWSSNADGPPNLTPEGFGLDSSIKVYDAIVYLIYCPEHDKVAVTNVERARVVWLPFVYLPEGVTWMKASQEGVAQIISQRDKEMDAVKAARMAPAFDMQCLNVLRIQLPSEKFVTRLANLVILRKSAESDFKCCTRSPRINWLRASDILNNRIDKVWGPELKNFTKLMVVNQTEHETVISEYSLQNTLHYLHLADSPEQKLLIASQVKTEHVLEIYEDFLEHCYPAFSMCFESFKHYLAKYGYDKKDPTLPYLFSAASLYGNDYLDFHEVLLCLVALEPTTANSLQARLKFVFRYYDCTRKGSLKMDELVVMVQEMSQSVSPTHEELSVEMLQKKVEDVIRCVGMNASNEVPETNFIKAVQTDRLPNTEKLCRSGRPILSQISKLIRGKVEKSKSASASEANFLANRPKTKGICYRCEAANYQYSLHCVSLDTTGRCVEPRIISDQWIIACPAGQMNEHRYSMDYVFGSSSMPNIIADMVRDFYHKSRDAGAVGKPTGIMSSKDDWPIFAKYTNMLCEAMKGLLQNEEKLLKVNAPALVLGDLQGNLHDLFVMEKSFWQSFPAMPNSILFLGNYTGVIGNGIECLAYLFSLKLIAPNKFFLLRGSQEMRSVNRKTLFKEATSKYGTNVGKQVYEMVNQVFERLPLAALIDETILCVHSGIPKSLKIAKINELKKDIDSVEKEAPLAYEVRTLPTLFLH